MRHQTIDRLAKQKTNYKVLMSGRSTGKSTSMAKYLKERYEKHGYKFIRLVRNITYTIEAGSYFDAFSNGGKFANKKQNCEITFEYYYESDGKRVNGDINTYYYNGKEFGKVFILSQSSKYKSGVYDEKIKTLCEELNISNIDINNYKKDILDNRLNEFFNHHLNEVHPFRHFSWEYLDNSLKK